MPILAWLLKQISGPLLLPAVLVGLMTTGGLLLKARDARTTALCDARWEREIRRQEQDAAASRIRAAEEQAENSSRAVERLTNERDKALQKIAEIPSIDGGDPRCIDDRVLDAFFPKAGGRSADVPKK